MSTARAVSLVAVLALLTGCGGGSPSRAPGPTVPVEGGSRDLRALTGHWEGEFVSARGSRRGTILFSLLGGRDSAYGRVVLRGPTAPPGCAEPVSVATGSRVEGEIVLTLARVHVAGRSVGGWLRPYPDPELGCAMDTWFEGTVTGDTLDGMYFSHPADTAQAVRLGTWWAARRR